MRSDRAIIIMLILLPLVLWIWGDWLSCYFMISGGSSWCDAILDYFGL